ncbi:MAG: disulfide bond formation protein B [Halioglobus sp.]
MLQSLSPRIVYFCIALVSAVSIAFAMYLEHQMGLHPCPLCMTQRVFIVLAGVIALIAALHNPIGLGAKVYGGFCALAAIVGGGVAVRHVWLQHLPPEEVPACGPSLEYMLETLPFSETLSIVMMGDGNCADVVWTFMGLSIPELTLLLFTAITAACLWQILRRPAPGA